jgi:hypothetical protein
VGERPGLLLGVEEACQPAQLPVRQQPIDAAVLRFAERSVLDEAVEIGGDRRRVVFMGRRRRRQQHAEQRAHDEHTHPYPDRRIHRLPLPLMPGMIARAGAPERTGDRR